MDWNNINRDRDTSGLGPIEYDQSKVPTLIRKHANNVRTKTYGQEVREAQARNAEYAGLIASEADIKATDASLISKDIESRYDVAVGSLTEDSEVLDARVNSQGLTVVNLKKRIDNQEYYINVKSFGAVGDGVTDDTVAIQMAFDFAKTAKSGTVYFPAGVYIISKPIIIYKGTSILGSGMTTTTVKKVGFAKSDLGLTYESQFIDLINFNDLDAIMLSPDELFGETFKDIRLEGNSVDEKTEYGLYIPVSAQVNVENVMVRFANTEYKFMQTWNLNFKKARGQFGSKTFEIGTDRIASTSVHFDTTFGDYNDVTYHLINITYFTMNNVASDFSKQVSYWFENAIGAINGMGVEYAEGQIIRSWLSNISIGGLYAIGVINNTDQILGAKSNAKIEVWSENRVDTGVSILSGDLRTVSGSGNASSYSTIGGSYLNIENVRDAAFRSSLAPEINSGSSAINRRSRSLTALNSVKTEISGDVSINGINYSKSLINYQSKSYQLPDKFVWTEMTGNNKTILNIPISEVVKRYPNFLNSDGYLTAPYSISIYFGGGSYIGGIKILGRNIYREKEYTLNTTNTIASTSVTSENLVITLTQNATYVKVFITEE